MNTPPTACSTPGCPGHAVQRGLCDKHLGDGVTPLRFTKWQSSPLYRRRDWVKFLRPFVLGRDPMCTMPPHLSLCGGRNPSNVVDHIIDHNGNHKLFFDPNNCRGVCKICHDHRTYLDHNPTCDAVLKMNAPPDP